MRVMELRALVRDHGLRNYSQLKRAEMVALLQNNPPPAPQMSTWEPIDDRLRPDRPTVQRPRQPSPQGMDIFEQQEMSKSRPQVKSELNDWYDWLINHVPKTVKDKASRAFRTSKDKIMGLYNRVTGFGDQTLEGPRSVETQLKGFRCAEPKAIELEQAFNGAYRSYRINGRPRMDVETFFHRIRGDLIKLIKRELNDLNSARVQITTWIRFVWDEPQERIDLAFNSLMMSVYQGSHLDQIVDRMITNMKFQIENPELLNSRFVFDEVLYLDTNFHWLNLTRGSSYLPLPDWIEKNKAIINPQNNDEEFFKWAVIMALEFLNIKSHHERMSNLTKFSNNYDWSGLEFPVSIKDIGVFATNNNISVNVLAVEGREIYIHRNGRWTGHKIDLLLVSENGINHYTAIKSLSRLLSSKNSNTKCKQHFCMNCIH